MIRSATLRRRAAPAPPACRSRLPAAGRSRSIQDLRSAAHLRDAEQQLQLVVCELEVAELALDPDEVAADELVEDPLALLGVDADGLEQRRVQGGVAEADPVVLQPGGVERGTEDGERLGGPLRRRGRRSARSRPGGTRATVRAAGARHGRRAQSSRSAAAARRAGSASRRAARSAPSCRSAARARCRARRTSGRPGAACRPPPARTSSRTRAPACTPRRSRRGRTRCAAAR